MWKSRILVGKSRTNRFFSVFRVMVNRSPKEAVGIPPEKINIGLAVLKRTKILKRQLSQPIDRSFRDFDDRITWIWTPYLVAFKVPRFFEPFICPIFIRDQEGVIASYIYTLQEEDEKINRLLLTVGFTSPPKIIVSIVSLIDAS